MAKIKVVSNQVEREITVDEPNVLGLSSLADLVESLGEELCINMVKNQTKISFRAVVRRKLEEKDDNGEFVNTDEILENEDYSDWKPSLRVTKTPEERASELLGSLPADVRAAVLANFSA